MASPTYSLARIFGADGTGEGIDFAAAGGLIGLASGIIGLIVGLIGLASGMIGVVGGVLGIVAGGLLGIVAGGVLGIVAGGVLGAVSTSIVLRDRSIPRSFGPLIICAGDRDEGPAASSLTAGAPPRVMRVTSRLMSQATGRRWLEEAESYLFETADEHRSRAIRSYLLTAPQMIAMSWITALTRRTRPSGDWHS
jgi:hypothetical protein